MFSKRLIQELRLINFTTIIILGWKSSKFWNIRYYVIICLCCMYFVLLPHQFHIFAIYRYFFWQF